MDDPTWKYIVTLGDRVVFRIDGSTQDGFAKNITVRGVNVSTGDGDFFVKWDYVVDVDKEHKAPWVMSTELPLPPKAFKERMEDLFSPRGYDEETAHAIADDTICDLLRSLGYGEGADIFYKAHKWYA